jgi:hypothetical protein
LEGRVHPKNNQSSQHVCQSAIAAGPYVGVPVDAFDGIVSPVLKCSIS